MPETTAAAATSPDPGVTSVAEAAPLAPAALDFAAAGRYLGGLSAKTVRALVRTGALPYSRAGTRPVVLVADLDAYLAERRTTTWEPGPRGGARPRAAEREATR